MNSFDNEGIECVECDLDRRSVGRSLFPVKRTEPPPLGQGKQEKEGQQARG